MARLNGSTISFAGRAATAAKETEMTRFTRLARLAFALVLLGGLALALMGPRPAAASGYSPSIWLTDYQHGDVRCDDDGNCVDLAILVTSIQVNGEGFAVGTDVSIGFYYPGEGSAFYEERVTAETNDGYLDGSFGKETELSRCDNGRSVEVQAYDFTNQVWSNIVTTKVCVGGLVAPAEASAVTFDDGTREVAQAIDPYVANPNDVAVNALAGSGQINLNAYRCDDDYGRIYNQLIAECTPIGGQSFTLTDYARSYSAYSNPDQPISWSGVAVGSISLTGQLTTDWETPVVFCEGAGANGGHNLATLPVNGNTVSTTLNADEKLDCFWFNMVIGANQSEETGSVTITKYACPAGFDAAAASLDDLRAMCSEPMNGILFGLNHPFNEYPDLFTEAPQTTGVLAPGLVSWETSPGDLTIAEQIPAGYGQPVVYCESWLPNFGYTGYNPAMVEGDRIAHDLVADEDLSCEWYNVPADEWDSSSGEGESREDASGGSFDSAGGNDEFNSAAVDSDGDGVSDEDELNTYGTDPSLTDSDDDGLNDADELFAFGTDPFNDDTDGDQLVDGDEVNLVLTDPAGFDTDGDGVDDGTEAYYNGTDPLDASSF